MSGRYEADTAPSIKIEGEWMPAGQGPGVTLEDRVAYSFINAPANSLKLSNVDLTHFSMIRKRDGWLVMLKGERPRMTVVAFLHGATYREALVLAVTCLDSGHVPWRESKPPPWEQK